jgi:hypothetical protein
VWKPIAVVHVLGLWLDVNNFINHLATQAPLVGTVTILLYLNTNKGSISCLLYYHFWHGTHGMIIILVLLQYVRQCVEQGGKINEWFKELTGETLAMGHCLKTLTLEMGISVETHSSGTCIVETHSSGTCIVETHSSGTCL